MTGENVTTKNMSFHIGRSTVVDKEDLSHLSEVSENRVQRSSLNMQGAKQAAQNRSENELVWHF